MLNTLWLFGRVRNNEDSISHKEPCVMSMKRKLMVIVMALGISLQATAIDAKDDPFEFGHHRVSLSGAISSSVSYMVEASYHYLFNYHVGIGAGLGVNQCYFVDCHPSGSGWQIDRNTAKPGNMYLHLSALLKTPSILFKSIRWGLMAEPGFALQIPYARTYVEETDDFRVVHSHLLSTSKGQVFSLDIKLGVCANFNRIGISAGYLLTNFDVNSYYNNFSYKGVSFAKYYPLKKLSDGFFLSASYYFGKNP